MSTNITWGVILIHVPHAGPIGILSAQASTSALPRLSGDSPGDPLRLRKLPDGLVRPRLCIAILNLGCLRRKAAAALACDYRVSGPGAVSYAELNAKFHSTQYPMTQYSGFNSAFKAAYTRAFPDPTSRSTPLGRVCSHSGHKSLVQWLWGRYR
eukprot:jgi/Tetstr1/423876/TSEL_014499.t1